MKVNVGYLLGYLKNGLLDLPTPVSLNYLYGVGFCLGGIYLMQVVSGLILSLFYSVGPDGGFWSLVAIMQEVWMGWCVRFIHSAGVSVFFFCVYLHVFRGVLYGGFLKKGVWVSGVLVLFMLMGVSFMGYVLPWGSMSYWGVTVVTSMIGAIPGIGGLVVEWVWGGPTVGVNTLARFFSLHYLVSLLLSLVILYHLVELHEKGSFNPLGVSSEMDKVVFHTDFSVKDIWGAMGVLLMYGVLVFEHPYALMDSANFEEVSLSSTPSHIKPEWYFLFAYSILRSVESKLGGVVLMAGSILGLLVLLASSSEGVSRFVGLKYWKSVSVVWGMSFIMLILLGSREVEYPYVELGKYFTCIYFLSLSSLVWLSWL
uniref:Cytochrome b n=1 Tax=Plagiorhynchus transversus TaxID=1795586 RepID=A0A140E9N1_9BILA|nr:cytochrome b [Plagiorhynchus transversus]AMK97082.1 cytochrome b [Plagiorhynchus transversus]